MNINEVLNSLNGFDAKENDSEYQELLKDLQLEKSITTDASDLNAKAQLKFIIDTAITIAATAAKAI